MESPPAKAAQAQTSNASVEPSTQTASPAPPDKHSGRAISKKNVGAGIQPDHVMQVTKGARQPAMGVEGIVPPRHVWGIKIH